MIALRACLRIPYAITFLAYAGGFFDMALREAYPGTFVTFIICPHRKCLREPFFHLRETIHVQVSDDDDEELDDFANLS